MQPPEVKKISSKRGNQVAMRARGWQGHPGVAVSTSRGAHTQPASCGPPDFRAPLEENHF